MKLTTSSGDFKWYEPTLSGALRHFKDTKFKNINLELSASNPEIHGMRQQLRLSRMIFKGAG